MLVIKQCTLVQVVMIGASWEKEASPMYRPMQPFGCATRLLHLLPSTLCYMPLTTLLTILNSNLQFQKSQV